MQHEFSDRANTVGVGGARDIAPNSRQAYAPAHVYQANKDISEK
jgi:hypothetical protein